MKSLVVWVVWGLAGLLLICGIISIASIPETQQYQICQHETAVQEGQGENLKKKTAVFFSCASEVVESHDKLIVAIGTAAIALFTLVLGVATVYLWYAGERQLSHSEQSMQRQLRAYVGARPDNVWKENSIALKVFFNNSGATPARKVFTRLTAKISLNALEEDFDFADAIVDTKASAATIFPSGVYETSERVFSFDDLRPGKHPVWIYMWGWIEYEDIFRKRHRTEFCRNVQIFQDGHVFLENYPEYNGVDEDCKYKPGKTPLREYVPDSAMTIWRTGL